MYSCTPLHMYTCTPLHQYTFTHLPTQDIVLPGLRWRGLGLVLDYIYTGQLSLSPANIQEVLACAAQLQVHSTHTVPQQFIIIMISMCRVFPSIPPPLSGAGSSPPLLLLPGVWAGPGQLCRHPHPGRDILPPQAQATGRQQGLYLCSCSRKSLAVH